MNAIAKEFKKLNLKKFLIIYILVQPIIDVVTSICVRKINPTLTLGIIVRSVFLFFLAVYSFIIANKKWRKIIFGYFLVLSMFVSVFLIRTISSMSFSIIFIQLKALFKIFYFPSLLMVLVPIMKKINIDAKYLKYTMFGYVTIITLSTIFGMAFDSYADGSGYGKNGLFYAANEIGTILSILMSSLFMDILKVPVIKNKKEIIKKETINLSILGCVIFSSLWMGTKVPFLGLVFTIVVSIGVCVINIIRGINIKFYICRTLVLIITFISIFSIIEYTPVGKNLGISANKIIKNFQESQTEKIENASTNQIEEKNKDKVNQIEEIDKDKVNQLEEKGKDKVNQIEEKDKDKVNQIEKSEKKNVSANSNVKNVVLSNRNIYYNNTLEVYKSSSVYSKFLGIGFLDNDNGKVLERKHIEIDYFDIIFCTGLVGAILFFMPLIISLLYIAKLAISRKNVFFDNKVVFYGYSVFIALTIAGMAGHVFTAPSVSFYLAIVIYQLINILKEISD